MPVPNTTRRRSGAGTASNRPTRTNAQIRTRSSSGRGFRDPPHDLDLHAQARVGYRSFGIPISLSQSSVAVSSTRRRTAARETTRATTSTVTDINPPRLTASPKTKSTSSSTTSLLPAATTHSQPAAASLARRVSAARSLVDDLRPEDDHQLPGDLEERRSQQREGTAFANDRRGVLDGEIEHDHVDEEVDHVGRPGPDPSADRTSRATAEAARRVSVTRARV
jgi:hypothetical protein